MYLRRIELRMVSDRRVPYESIPDGIPEGLKIKNEREVFRAFSFLSNLVQEEMYALYLDTKCKVLGFYMVSRGTTDKAICSPADVIRPALLLGSSSIILIHNHPSGDCEPSPEDIALTRAIHKACEIMGLKLCDHVIIGSLDYRSIISMI